MKKILILGTLMCLCNTIYAGTGALTVVNTTGCDYVVTMHARSVSMGCGVSACADIVAVLFTIPAGTTYSWTDPYDFEIGTCYDPACSCGCTIVGGWASLPGSWGSSTSINPFSYWSPSTYPSDWIWTYATVDYVSGSCGCGVTGNIGQPACGSATISYVCGGTTYYAHWAYSGCGSPPCDVTITIHT